MRHPGGKSRATKLIREYIPAGTDALAVPFLGRGSLELACAAAGMRVYGSDAFAPLVAFWRQALAQPPVSPSGF